MFLSFFIRKYLCSDIVKPIVIPFRDLNHLENEVEENIIANDLWAMESGTIPNYISRIKKFLNWIIWKWESHSGTFAFRFNQIISIPTSLNSIILDTLQ